MRGRGARPFVRASLALALLAAPFVASAQSAPAVQAPEAALAQDAAEYARLYSLAPGEALRRLDAQSQTVAETERLRETYGHRLAGISIEHRPDYRIVVLLTGRKKVKSRTVLAGGMKVPVVFRTGAPATRDRIVSAIERHGDEIRKLAPGARGMGVDPRTGRLVIMISRDQARTDDLDRLAEAAELVAGVPVSLRLIERDANLAIEGGARVEGIDTVSGRRAYCTTGYVVTDGSRTGIVTAAHCPDALTYVEPGGRRTELPFLGQWGWSFQDVQLNVSAEAQRPVFFADTAKGSLRSLAGARGRASTRAGDILCHRGERTGYSCAEVELTDYAPPGELCGGPCAPTWVTVSGPSCGSGDSGGPVFSGNIAYGIVKGATYTGAGRCAFYYYMSLDYLPEGWSLLKDEPAQALSGTRPKGAPTGF